MTRRRDEPPLRYEWERVIKALPLPSGAKHVALNSATYADAAGGSIFPGNERTVADTGLSDSTVRRAYKLLRDVGLLERVVEGRSLGRRGVADEYRMAIPADVLERVVNASRTPVRVTGDTAPNTGQGDRSSAGGAPVTQTGTPVTGTRNTGQGDRTPTQHQPIEQPTAPVLDVTTDRARANGHPR